MTTSNPSHLLISRNSPRSPTHTHLVPTFAARHSSLVSLDANDASAHHRTQSAPINPSSLNLPEETEEEGGEEVETVEVHPTFRRDAALSGTVKVRVGGSDFWCHKEILYFASPFFQGLLQGCWAETACVTDRSSSPFRRDTDVDPLPVLAEHPTSSFASSSNSESPNHEEEVADSRKTSVYLDASEDEPSITDILRELRELPDSQIHVSLSDRPSRSSGATSSHIDPSYRTQHDETPLDHDIPSSSSRRRRSSIRHSFSSGTDNARRPTDPVAVVELHETSPSAFQDFLMWAYPHMECKVSWTNVEDLLALASKLLVPSLQKMCENFLVSHASGKPIVALSLAETYEHADLYREASRFVLDQSTWDHEEMSQLTETTRLKLSHRRTWFLERLLKLGSIDVRKEYSCRVDCPDPAKCQTQLDEKWRQANSTVSRYGPPQPSVAFRALTVGCIRQLETFPTNPSLVMPHPLCQSAAKAWVMTCEVFDRMFQPKMISHPLNPGTEKYWLWISL
ncbi:hypothetical protein M231_02191 [Tremella mesenterica]|uniref:BTB domain-containing protein n=1 Tax=Tremella mesenterica TaxID=5217 RepID=A0A4Q1BRH1_TREME|nr:hypothetical protein M231_02191 [Tremella mesenterica]